MPWVSRSPSPSGTAPLTYIAPLIDAACGTTPRALRDPFSLLREDASAVMLAMPHLTRALWSEITVAVTARRSWAGAMDVAVHVVLATLEIAMMIAAVPLWAVLPGSLFSLLLGASVALVLGLSRRLNGRQVVWCGRPECEDERWIVVEGLDISSRYFSQSTLPALSRLFGRPMTGLCTPSYGLPLDLLFLVLRRSSAEPPCAATRALHTQLRAALLDPTLVRVVVLTHGLGAATLAGAIPRLCSDLPADRLTKLEIYTFGAAAAEFVFPGSISPVFFGGGSPASSSAGSPRRGRYQWKQQQQKPPQHEIYIGRPHIEHFALANDPLARLGVLHAARRDLLGRFCGGVFVIEAAGGTRSLSSGLILEDYLATLFPASGGALDAVVAVDRDAAEKREFAAMSGCTPARRHGAKRLSWTALGATIGYTDGGGGVAGLEVARRGCREYDGRRGQDISRLSRYVGGRGGTG